MFLSTIRETQSPRNTTLTLAVRESLYPGKFVPAKLSPNKVVTPHHLLSCLVQDTVTSEYVAQMFVHGEI